MTETCQFCGREFDGTGSLVVHLTERHRNTIRHKLKMQIAKSLMLASGLAVFVGIMIYIVIIT